MMERKKVIKLEGGDEKVYTRAFFRFMLRCISGTVCLV